MASSLEPRDTSPQAQRVAHALQVDAWQAAAAQAWQVLAFGLAVGALAALTLGRAAPAAYASWSLGLAAVLALRAWAYRRAGQALPGP